MFTSSAQLAGFGSGQSVSDGPMSRGQPRLLYRPVFGPGHETSRQRIGLDVSTGCDQLKVSDDDNVLVSGLVEMPLADRSVPTLGVPNVRSGQPVHVRRKCCGPGGANHQMEVIRHQAIGEKSDDVTPGGPNHERQKGQIILVILKQRLPFVAAVEHVMRITWRESSASSRHHRLRLPSFCSAISMPLGTGPKVGPVPN